VQEQSQQSHPLDADILRWVGLVLDLEILEVKIQLLVPDMDNHPAIQSLGILLRLPSVKQDSSLSARPLEA
jgi:hypothetical protein